MWLKKLADLIISTIHDSMFMCSHVAPNTCTVVEIRVFYETDWFTKMQM